MQGAPPTCKCSTKGKAKGIAWQEGESRQQLFFQCVIRPRPGVHCKEQGTGGLCSTGWGREKRVIQKRSKQERSKSQQEGGNGHWGQEELPRHSSYWSVPHRQTGFFQAEKPKSHIARACVFPASLLIPLSAVTCTFENYISLESCDSGISSTRVLMCQ